MDVPDLQSSMTFQNGPFNQSLERELRSRYAEAVSKNRKKKEKKT
jgi:hypothetical protein